MSEAVVETAPDTIESLRARLQDAENEFGQKRAQFRSMYLGCEAALQEEKQLRLKSVEQIEKLSKEIEALKSENQGVRAAAQLSDESRQEEISRIKSKHQEELASYQHIWKEAVREGKTAVANGFEEERQQLITKVQQLEQQLIERHCGKVDDKSEGLMSTISQAIKRSTGSPHQQPNAAQVKPRDGTTTLEATMKEAQENAETLRNIVRPLEEEIAMLKGKVKDYQAKLRGYENKNKSSSLLPSASDTAENSGSLEELQEKSKELQGYLDAERSSRTDLEMFVAVLNTQKGVLQEDADALRTELHNVCRLLEQERMSHRELKQTWRMANDEFLEQQTTLVVEIECMRGYLNQNQLEKLSKELRRRKAERTRPTKKRPSTSSKDSNLIVFDSAPHPSRVSPIPSPSANDNRLLVLSSSSSSCDSDTENEAPTILSSISIEQGEEADEDVKHLVESCKLPAIRKSASSSNILTTAAPTDGTDLTDAPSKSRSQGDISCVDSNGDVVNSGDPTRTELDAERNLHLNETGWSPMSEANSYHPSCMMCQNYEKQLQRLQKECIAYKEKDDGLQTTLRTQKERSKTQDSESKALQTAITASSEDAQNQVSTLRKQQEQFEKQLVDMQSDFLALHHECIEQMDFVKERQSSSTAAVDEAGVADTDSGKRDDDIQTSDDGQSSKEQELSGQIMFLKDRVMAEQFDKENMEKILQQDLDIARQEIELLKEKLAQSEQ